MVLYGRDYYARWQFGLYSTKCILSRVASINTLLWYVSSFAVLVFVKILDFLAQQTLYVADVVSSIFLFSPPGSMLFYVIMYLIPLFWTFSINLNFFFYIISLSAYIMLCYYRKASLMHCELMKSQRNLLQCKDKISKLKKQHWLLFQSILFFLFVLSYFAHVLLILIQLWTTVPFEPTKD